MVVCIEVADEDAPIAADLVNRFSPRFIKLAQHGIDQFDVETIARIQTATTKIIVAEVDGPELVSQLYLRGIELVQGPFVQPPRNTLEFDFRT